MSKLKSDLVELKLEFAERVLTTMEEHHDWGSDTMDEINDAAIALGLGGGDGEGRFIRNFETKVEDTASPNPTNPKLKEQDMRKQDQYYRGRPMYDADVSGRIDCRYFRFQR